MNPATVRRLILIFMVFLWELIPQTGLLPELFLPSLSSTLAVLDAPKPPPARVTLSARRLSRTRHALFLVAGEGKRDAVRRWHAGAELPARAIAPAAGVDVFVEATLLPSSPA